MVNVNRPGGVYHDVRNPIRLAAVARGDVHYAGDTCFRNHAGLRYAKSGKCVLCAHEDRRTYGNTPAGRAERERHHTRKAIKKRQGPGLGPNKEWWRRREFYDNLVAAGLPVDVSVSLNVRVNTTWEAMQELTNDHYILPEVRLAAKAERQVLRAERRTRSERRKQEWEKLTARCNELNAIADERGVDRVKFRGWVNAGKTIDEAVVKCLEPGKRKRRAEQRRIATSNGLKWATVISRVHVLGWSWDRAITEPPIPHGTPTHPSHMPDAETRLAIACGVKPSTYKARLRRGLPPKEALSKETIKHSLKGRLREDSMSGRCRAVGISRSAICIRMAKRGITFEEAVALGPSPMPHPKGMKYKKRYVGPSPEELAFVYTDNSSQEWCLTDFLFRVKDRACIPAKGYSVGRGRHPNPFREAARAAGDKTYATFDPCTRCFTDERYTSNAACVACSVARGIGRYAAMTEEDRAALAAKDQARYQARKVAEAASDFAGADGDDFA